MSIHTNGSSVRRYKLQYTSGRLNRRVVADKPIVFEDEEDSEEEKDQDKEMTEASKVRLSWMHIWLSDWRPKQETESSTQAVQEVPTTAEPQQGDGSSALPPSLPAPGPAKLIEEEEERTHTPKLDDVSDNDNESDHQPLENDDMDDPAKHPASNPHVHPRMEEEAAAPVGVVPERSEPSVALVPEAETALQPTDTAVPSDK